MPDIIVIVGPTGVGKTKLSIELAKRLNAEIINGDSVSIYKDLNIGSAKPTVAERQNIPHHLLDICDTTENYSVFNYQKDARALFTDITNRGKRIIIVGGTGLYIKAALYDYRFTEGTTYNTYPHLSNDELLAKIKNYQVTNLPHVNNRKRLIRLLNKLENNEEISNNSNKLLYPIKVIGLTTERSLLYQRINNRVDEMFNNGLVNEIKSLQDKYPHSRVLNTGIGYKEFVPYLAGTLSLDEVKDQIKLDSRRYAKRQYTFFNHQLPTTWFNVNFHDFSATITEVYNFLIKN